MLTVFPLVFVLSVLIKPIPPAAYFAAFTDVTSCGFSDDAPDYRSVERGINIDGICKTTNCIAQNQKVIVEEVQYSEEYIKLRNKNWTEEYYKTHGINDDKNKNKENNDNK